MAYHRFAANTADVEGFLAEWGIIVSQKLLAKGLRPTFGTLRSPEPADPKQKWHLDEAVIIIVGAKYW
ncbi:hypothetical protein LAB1_56500 [Roseibium sp. LAB1]